MTHPLEDNRGDWSWLNNTYWYCPAECMPAIQTQSSSQFQWMTDQTVWHITGYKDGYFWGVGAALLTPCGEEPDIDNKTDLTFYASLTPEGQAYITFLTSNGPSTIGVGHMTTYLNKPGFEMQMSSGPTSSLAVHWAYMLQIQPDDPQWHILPGAGVSVEEMIGNQQPPEPINTAQ